MGTIIVCGTLLTASVSRRKRKRTRAMVRMVMGSPKRIHWRWSCTSAVRYKERSRLEEPLMNLHASHFCRLLIVAALAGTIPAASSRAEDRVLKMGRPEQVGMSGRRLEIVNQILADETRS